MSIAHLRLSIDVGSDPIQGLVLIGDQAPQPFYGWVELTVAIEAVRAPRPPEPDPRANAGKD